MYNKAILVGNIANDLELKKTPSDVSYLNFNLAVNRQGSKEKATDFIPIVAWRKTAEFIEQYFQKGSPILLEGAIRVESYKDKEGNSRTAIKVIADRVSFVGSKKESNNSVNASTGRQSAAKESSEPEFEMTEYEEDDLPF